MSDQDFFVLDEDALLRLNDLVECLGIAIEKIVVSNRFIKGSDIDHPAISGFKRMAEEADLKDIY